MSITKQYETLKAEITGLLPDTFRVWEDESGLRMRGQDLIEGPRFEMCFGMHPGYRRFYLRAQIGPTRMELVDHRRPEEVRSREELWTWICEHAACAGQPVNQADSSFAVSA